MACDKIQAKKLPESAAEHYFCKIIGNANGFPGFKRFYGKHELPSECFYIDDYSRYAVCTTARGKRLYDGLFKGKYAYLPLNESGHFVDYDLYILKVGYRTIYMPYSYVVAIMDIVDAKYFSAFVRIDGSILLAAYDSYRHKLDEDY